MGDWNSEIGYEYREYYTHFYDPCKEEEPEEEDNEELMTREEAITALGDRNNLLWGMSKEEQKYYSEALDMAIASLKTDEVYQLEYENRDFVEIHKGMTNGEMLQASFPDLMVCSADFGAIEYANTDVNIMASRKWLESPYKKGEIND